MCPSTPRKAAGFVRRFRIDVENRDYHYLSQCEIGRAKRFTWRYSLDIGTASTAPSTFILQAHSPAPCRKSRSSAPHSGRSSAGIDLRPAFSRGHLTIGRSSYDRALKRLPVGQPAPNGTFCTARQDGGAGCRESRERTCEHPCSIESLLFFCCSSRQDTHLAFANRIPHGESIRFSPPCAQFALTYRDSTARIGTSSRRPDSLSECFIYSPRFWHGS